MARADERQGRVMQAGPRGKAILAPVLILLAGALAAPAVQGQAVVQPLPRASASQALNAALVRLGHDPRDLDALIDAGKAALGMGDIDAAVGFFARADQLSPDNMRVKGGLAGALVRSPTAEVLDGAVLVRGAEAEAQAPASHVGIQTFLYIRRKQWLFKVNNVFRYFT